MHSRVLFVQLPLLTLVAAFAFLILAHTVWRAQVFGLLAQPLFFVLALFALALIFYYLTLLYLLLRPHSKSPA